MSEKDMFLQTWEREFQTTLKVLKAYPASKLDFKPHERSMSAKELAWGFATGETVLVNGVVKGEVDFQSAPKPPAAFSEILSAYEKTHREMVGKVKNFSEADFNKSIPVPVGPKQMGEVRGGDLLWLIVMDGVHHRGQFSVYLRLAGGKVPSIYGPSADEPWF